MSPRSPVIAFVLVTVSLVGLALPVGCGEDPRGPARDALPAAPPPRAVGPAEPEPAPPAAGDAPPTVDVAARVVTERDEPVVGRSVVLVDRRGRRTEVMTDEEGTFHVATVAPPYDLLVAAAPSGAIVTPVGFLGVTRAEPRLELFEPRGPIPRPATQRIKVGVRLPPCRATAGACWVSVVSSSASGGGANAASFVEGAPPAILEIDHAWSREATQPGETVDVHVLTGSADYTEYAYTRLREVPARPGETVDAGMVAPTRVDATDRVTVTAQAAPLPAGWQWTVSSWLDLPGGASFALRYEWSPATAMRLPKLPGATFHVSAWAQEPPAETRPYFHRSSHAWSGTLPLGVANVALDVPIGPETLRPRVDGTMSRRGVGPAWDTSVKGLHTLVVVDLVHGRQELRVYTGSPEVSSSRMEALGLPKLAQGEHVLDLTTRPGADVDELTQPDERLRRRRFDGAAPGATTYQRFRFMVTE